MSRFPSVLVSYRITVHKQCPNLPFGSDIDVRHCVCVCTRAHVHVCVLLFPWTSHIPFFYAVLVKYAWSRNLIWKETELIRSLTSHLYLAAHWDRMPPTPPPPPVPRGLHFPLAIVSLERLLGDVSVQLRRGDVGCRRALARDVVVKGTLGKV